MPVLEMRHWSTVHLQSATLTCDEDAPVGHSKPPVPLHTLQ